MAKSYGSELRKTVLHFPYQTNSDCGEEDILTTLRPYALTPLRPYALTYQTIQATLILRDRSFPCIIVHVLVPTPQFLPFFNALPSHLPSPRQMLLTSPGASHDRQNTSNRQCHRPTSCFPCPCRLGSRVNHLLAHPCTYRSRNMVTWRD